MSYGRTRTVGPADGAIHGAVVYLGLSIGAFLTIALGQFLAGGDSVIFTVDSDDKLYTAATLVYSQLGIVVPLLAVGLVIYYAAADQSGPAFLPAAVGAAVGTALAGLVLVILMILFAPDGANIGFGDELPVLVSLTVGGAITAVVSGLGFELV